MRTFEYWPSERKVKVYPTRKSLTSKNVLRFDIANVDFLAKEFLPADQIERRGGALSPRRQMEIFLRYVGGPSFQEEVAYDTGTHRTTVCKTLKNVLNKIVKRANHWMKFPSCPEEIEKAKAEWAASGRTPGAIGAVDCMRVRIKPPSTESRYFDPVDKTANLNVMATCDADARFTSIEANWPGTVHDADAWLNSSVRKLMADLNAPAWLLGDSNFNICPWLITPFGSNTLDEDQEKFNAKHTKDRQVINTAWNELFARFPILDPAASCIQLSFKRIPKLLVSCAVLHNMAKHLNDECEFSRFNRWNNNYGIHLRNRFYSENIITHFRGVTIREEMLRSIDPT